jgi:hypothetical protein
MMIGNVWTNQELPNDWRKQVKRTNEFIKHKREKKMYSRKKKKKGLVDNLHIIIMIH